MLLMQLLVEHFQTPKPQKNSQMCLCLFLLPEEVFQNKMGSKKMPLSKRHNITNSTQDLNQHDRAFQTICLSAEHNGQISRIQSFPPKMYFLKDVTIQTFLFAFRNQAYWPVEIHCPPFDLDHIHG